MAIVRPQKPPLVSGRAPSPVTVGGAPATSVRPQPRAPQPTTRPNIPSGQSTPETTTVTDDPASVPITEQEVLDTTAPMPIEPVLETGEVHSSDALLTGAALAAALGLRRLNQRQSGQTDDSMAIAESNTETLDRALEAGTITEEQYNSIDPATGDGVDAVSEGADGTGASERVSQTATPSAEADDATRPIATDDIISQTDAASSGNSTVTLPGGFMATDQVPPNTAIDQRSPAARRTEADVRIDRATGDVWAQQPDGSWSVRRGSGQMQPTASYDHPSNAAWRAAREALRAIR